MRMKSTGGSRSCATARGAATSALRTAVALALAATLALGGCNAMRGLDSKGRPLAKHFKVDVSGLDWVIIIYYPHRRNQSFTRPVYLALNGTGEIDFKCGRSPLVWNDFSDQVDDPYWNELFVDRKNIPPKRMEKIYQALVDEGLFPRYDIRAMNAEDLSKRPLVRIRAKIGMERTLRVMDDPAVIEIIESVLENFEHLGRAAARLQEEDEGEETVERRRR